MKGTRIAVAGMVVLVLAGARPAVAGPEKNGKAVAYAKVSLNDGSVLSFGGNKTSNAVGSLNTVGDANVTFTGKYPASITVDQVILQATCEYGLYCVANARVLTVTATSIMVEVGAWGSSSLAPLSNNAFVTAFIGQ